MRHLLSMTGTLHHVARTGAVDAYNDPTTTTTVEALPCWVEQAAPGERGGLTEVEWEDWRLYCAAGTAIDADDRIDLSGLGTFEVAGPPWPAVNPRTGRRHHVEARLRKVR